MFELIGGLIEASAGYLTGRFQASNKTASHISIAVVSLLCGLILFIGLGAYELIFPSPKIPENWGYALILFSVAISLFSFLCLELDYWWKRRKAKSQANSE